VRLRFRFLNMLSVFFTLAAGIGCDRAGTGTGTAAPDAYAVYVPAAEPPAQCPPPVFSRDVAPLLEQYCLHCHDGAAAEGGIVLEELGDATPNARLRPLLLRVADNLRADDMPPAGEPRPSGAELETINSWLDTMLSDRDAAPRRVSVRRLNRAEFNNTIRDLIGLDLRPADEFPSDDVG
jgi:hypothetical protein